MACACQLNGTMAGVTGRAPHELLWRCLVLLLWLVVGCGEPTTGIARLVRSQGVIEKSTATKPWQPVAVGAWFGLGDAARSATTGATFETTGGARIEMKPNSILRFGKAGNRRLSVEAGEVDLVSSGAYELDVGRIEVKAGGNVRISAGAAGPKVQLLVGDAVMLGADAAVNLELGRAYELSVGRLEVVPDRPAPDAPLDVPSPSELAVDVTGDGAEVLLPGASQWKRLAIGRATLLPGAQVRVTKQAVVAFLQKGLRLEAVGGALVDVTGALGLVVRRGKVSAHGARGASYQVSMSTGTVVMDASQEATHVVMEVEARESKVALLDGRAAVVDAQGARVELARGDMVGVLAKGGLRLLEQAPRTFDLQVAAGDSFTVHEGSGQVAVRIAYDCADAEIQVARDAAFASARSAFGAGGANVRLTTGGWHYRARCGKAAARQGRVLVLRDAGERRLSPVASSNSIEADGRKYVISYQSVLPNVTIAWRGAAPGAYKLHLAIAGKEQVLAAAGPVLEVRGNQLREGTYTYWFERADGFRSRPSTLKLDFDQQAAQVYVESPRDGQAFGDPVTVKGATLAGWQVTTVEGVPLPLDRQRRFVAQLASPPSKVMTIRFVHPQQGTHYYVRRGT